MERKTYVHTGLLERSCPLLTKVLLRFKCFAQVSHEAKHTGAFFVKHPCADQMCAQSVLQINQHIESVGFAAWFLL